MLCADQTRVSAEKKCALAKALLASTEIRVTSLNVHRLGASLSLSLFEGVKSEESEE